MTRDVVPLLLECPALAIVAGGHVVAVRDSMGGLSIHPERRGTLNHLYAHLRKAEEKLLELREVINNERDTKERLLKYAAAIWKRARKAVWNYKPSASPPTRGKKKG